MDPAAHAKKLSGCLEDLGDAFLRTEKGKTAKAVGSIVAAKIAADLFSLVFYGAKSWPILVAKTWLNLVTKSRLNPVTTSWRKLLKTHI